MNDSLMYELACYIAGFKQHFLMDKCGKKQAIIAISRIGFNRKEFLEYLGSFKENCRVPDAAGILANHEITLEINTGRLIPEKFNILLGQSAIALCRA